MNARFSRGVSPITITAALSIAALLAATGIQLGKTFANPVQMQPEEREPVEMPSYLAIEDENGNGVPDWQDELVRVGLMSSSTSAVDTEGAATSTDPLSGIGQALTRSLVSGYLSLAEYDAYTPQRGEQLANTIADSFKAPATFMPHTADVLLLDDDVSTDRALQYRADMRIALEPMIADEEHELTLYAAYIETGDTSWLDRLQKLAENYRAAEANLLKVRIPQDAAPEHLRVTNAIGAYAETLERMIHFAKDPLATMALLRTYNEREREFDLAFDALVKYYARKVGNN